MKTYVVGTQKNHLDEIEDGFFEHPKQMFKLRDEENFTNLRYKVA